MTSTLLFGVALCASTACGSSAPNVVERRVAGSWEVGPAISPEQYELFLQARLDLAAGRKDAAAAALQQLRAGGADDPEWLLLEVDLVLATSRGGADTLRVEANEQVAELLSAGLRRWPDSPALWNAQLAHACQPDAGVLLPLADLPGQSTSAPVESAATNQTAGDSARGARPGSARLASSPRCEAAAAALIARLGDDELSTSARWRLLDALSRLTAVTPDQIDPLLESTWILERADSRPRASSPGRRMIVPEQRARQAAIERRIRHGIADSEVHARWLPRLAELGGVSSALMIPVARSATSRPMAQVLLPYAAVLPPRDHLCLLLTAGEARRAEVLLSSSRGTTLPEEIRRAASLRIRDGQDDAAAPVSRLCDR